MFFSHMPELLALLAVALVVFGPKRLPEIGSSMGKGIRDFKRGLSEFTEEPNRTLPVVAAPDESSSPSAP